MSSHHAVLFVHALPSFRPYPHRISTVGKCMGLALVHMKSAAMPLAWTSFMQYKCIRDDLRDTSRHSSSSVRCITLGYLECLRCLCLWVKILAAPLKNSHVS